LLQQTGGAFRLSGVQRLSGPAGCWAGAL